MERYSFLLLPVFLACLLNSAEAQTPSQPINPASSGNTEVFTVEKTSGSPISGTRIISNPTEMFQGWSQLYKGYDRTPILFDSLRDGRRRAHPRAGFPQSPSSNYFTAEEQDHLRNHSIKVFNLGVDDEVSKTSMTVYQPLHVMQNDFASDPMSRDNHLDLFQTLRGTAILTLSYLDKTVAAGLATTQSQTDAHLTNQLLKQLNWTSTKLANPQRALLYQDIDEKVETCLKFGSQAAFPRTGRVRFNEIGTCNSICRDHRHPVPGPQKTGGNYDYCVCCAEVVANINATYRDGTFTAADKNRNQNAGTFSLVDRIFLGTEGHQAPGNTIPAQQRQIFTDNMANFRELYGDIILSPCNRYAYQETGVGAQTDKSTCVGDETFKIEYRLPELSVADKIKIFRDGLPDPSQCANREGTGCPLVGSSIKDGICPAIHKIMLRWPVLEGDDEATMQDLFIQASMGRIITANDVNNFFIMAKLQPGELRNAAFHHDLRRMNDQGWSRVDDRFKRYLGNFCDAMAVAAFRKFHYRMMSIIEDQLRINQKATDHDKAKIKDLMARVSAQIELAERDYESSSVADRILAGLEIEASREQVGNLQAAQEAQNAAYWQQQFKNRATQYNWFK